MDFQPQDVVKRCFQAAYGAEHLLLDKNAARAYFDEEMSTCSNSEVILIESLSLDVCRVNMGAWKALGFPTEWLFNLFALSASTPRENADEYFQKSLIQAEKQTQEGAFPFSFADWQEYISAYKTRPPHPVRHSQEYRDHHNPAYRVISGKYVRLLRVFSVLAEKPWGNGTCTLPNGTVNVANASRAQTPSPQNFGFCNLDMNENLSPKVLIISIDGRAGSGKSTLAEGLAQVAGAAVVRMDDFFLPVNMRTEERLSQVGGNVHYERFAEEVLPFLRSGAAFSYNVFDCGVGDFCGVREIPAAPILVVEGSYSCHPFFGDYADFRVFADVSPDEQLRRIEFRNGKDIAKIFADKWIPAEEMYFKQHSILQNADVVI